MADIVLNTLGALCSVIFLRIFPYRHKGKYDLNALYSKKDEKEIKYEDELSTVNG